MSAGQNQPAPFTAGESRPSTIGHVIVYRPKGARTWTMHVKPDGFASVTWRHGPGEMIAAGLGALNPDHEFRVAALVLVGR